jgi:4-amino-4-deoxy-L-arabinose transferase-like glycosyltransferase
MGVGLGVVVHLIMGALIDLSPDEAHYALYASHLDWSYYDHPPLVGWLQWLFLQLGGSNMWMRVVPMLAWVLTAWGVIRLSDALYPQIAKSSVFGLRVDLLLLLLSPIPHLLGFALTPDALLMPLTCWVMWLTWQLCQSDEALSKNNNADQRLASMHADASSHRLVTWLLLGLALGLSGLAKYTAVLLALGVVLALCRYKGWRWLLQLGPWLAFVVALLCVMPVLYWNAIHDWASFVYQANHAAGNNAWQARKLLLYVVVVIISFGLVVPWALRMVAQSRKISQAHPQASGLQQPAQHAPHIAPGFFAASFGLPGVLLLFYLSGRGSTLPHWVAPFFIALLPMVAAGVVVLIAKHPRTVRWILAIQALVCMAMFTLMLTGGFQSENEKQAMTPPGVGVDEAPKNPFADLHGWSQAAEHGVRWAKEKNVPTLAVTNWTLASRIAWYARPMPVRVVNAHGDQFDIWFGRFSPHEDAIWIDWSLMSFTPPVGDTQFARCDVLENLPVRVAGRQIAHFNLSHCQDWQGPSE